MSFWNEQICNKCWNSAQKCSSCDRYRPLTDLTPLDNQYACKDCQNLLVMDDSEMQKLYSDVMHWCVLLHSLHYMTWYCCCQPLALASILIVCSPDSLWALFCLLLFHHGYCPCRAETLACSFADHLRCACMH